MRCMICDSILTDYELTRKNQHTGEFLDTCSECTRSVKDALNDFEEPKYKHDIGVGNELEDNY